MAITELKCPSCGAPLDMNEDSNCSVCQYCGNQVKENNQYVMSENNFDYGDEKSLLERAFLLIEAGDFNNGDNYLDKVLNINPQNAKAYIGKLQCSYRIRKTDCLSDFDNPLTSYDYYNKAIRFAQRDDLQYYMQLNDKIIERLNKEKEAIEQKLAKLERDISSSKDYLTKNKSIYDAATAIRGRWALLLVFSTIVLPFMIVGVIMEHSLVMLAIGILFIILIILSYKGIFKSKTLIKEYKEVKRELKSNEAKFKNEQQNMSNLLKKLMVR